MGVYMDKYIGYVMDIKEEVEKIRKENWDDFFETYILDDNPIPVELKKLGLKTRYDSEGLHRGDIEIIYDGMSGRFAYIMLIEEVERDSEDYSEFSDIVLDSLREKPVDDIIKNKIKKVYEILFNNKSSKEVYLTGIKHYH